MALSCHRHTPHASNVSARPSPVETDFAFLPIFADLRYVTGIPRELPDYGAVIHPGGWIESAWQTPPHAASRTWCSSRPTAASR